MEEKKLIAAPIDEKNVTSDWIETIFDYFNIVVGGKRNNTYLGFVDDVPVIAEINANHIKWSSINGNMPAMLEIRLKEYETDADELNLFSVIEKEGNNVIFQSFYFKEED